MYSWNQLKEVAACGGKKINHRLIPAPKPRIIPKYPKYKEDNSVDHGKLLISIVCEEVPKLCRTNPTFEGRQMLIYNDTREMVVELPPNNSVLNGKSNHHVFEIGMRHYARYISNIACMGHVSATERAVMPAISLYRKYLSDFACASEETYYTLYMNDITPAYNNETHWFYRCYLTFMNPHRTCPLPITKTMIISSSGEGNQIQQNTTGEMWGVVDGGGALYGEFAVSYT